MIEDTNDRWVAKVHPLERDVEPDDPLELLGECVPGDPSVMLDCILQEFAWMGCGPSQLLAMFSHPGYPVLCQLRELLGDDEIRRRVKLLVDQGGVMQFQATVTEEEEDPVPPLYQIEW